MSYMRRDVCPGLSRHDRHLSARCHFWHADTPKRAALLILDNCYANGAYLAGRLEEMATLSGGNPLQPMQMTAQSVDLDCVVAQHCCAHCDYGN